VLAGGVASGWRPVAGGFSAQPVDLDGVESLAADGTGTLWLVADGALHRRDTDGTLRAIDFPAPLSEVWALGAADLWLTDGESWWHHAGGTYRPVEGVPAGATAGVDTLGRLLIRSVEGLARVSLDRGVVFLGLADGSRVDLDTTVTLAPSFADLVEGVEASIDGAALEVEAGPWRVSVGAEALGDGDHRLDVSIEYADGERADASVFFYKGDVAPVTWDADLEPLYEARCDYCHGASGGAHRLDSPEAWELDIDRILDAVESGRMPRLPPRLNDAEIHLIERWRAGGFQ
jgi:hypothetical protein